VTETGGTEYATRAAAHRIAQHGTEVVQLGVAASLYRIADLDWLSCVGARIAIPPVESCTNKMGETSVTTP